MKNQNATAIYVCKKKGSFLEKENIIESLKHSIATRGEDKKQKKKKTIMIVFAIV